MRRRLRQTRWPEPEPVDDWSQGVPLGYLRELCEYWDDGYDWRATEARLNALPLFQTEIDGHPDRVRCTSVRRIPDALPLILTHGWPGSMVEFMKVIGPLSDPGARRRRRRLPRGVPVAARATDSAASPTGPGWGVERIARAWAVLMERLGYARYGAAGQRLGHQREHPARPAGPGARGGRPPDPAAGRAGSGHLRRPDRRGNGPRWPRWSTRRSGTRGTPGSRRPGRRRSVTRLVDSPAALAAWIVEKFWAWTDHDGAAE